jgi:hypothetical protein
MNKQDYIKELRVAQQHADDLDEWQQIEDQIAELDREDVDKW